MTNIHYNPVSEVKCKQTKPDPNIKSFGKESNKGKQLQDDTKEKQNISRQVMILQDIGEDWFANPCFLPGNKVRTAPPVSD